MKRAVFLWACVSVLATAGAGVAAGDPNDAAGSSDPPLFSRMTGFHISNYQEKDFDRYEFTVGPDRREAVEGRHVYVDYYANDGIKLPSALQIVRNYMNAATAIGGETVYAFEDGGSEYATLKVVKNDAEVWAAVEGGGNGIYKIHVVEKRRMKQDVTVNAAGLAGSISTTGKAAVYGIFFDTGKAEIKPASEPAIGEIAKMLEADPKLKLFVVGHTDTVGAFESNVRLSQARAASVVSALVNKQGIVATRLTPFGAGPTAPVASNTTEEGRARNRRVELVAQ